MTAGIFFFLRDVFVSVNILLLCRYFLGFELRKRRAAGIVTAVLFALNSAAYTYGRFTPSVGETTDIVTDLISYALYLFVFFVFVNVCRGRKPYCF